MSNETPSAISPGVIVSRFPMVCHYLRYSPVGTRECVGYYGRDYWITRTGSGPYDVKATAAK